MDAAYTRRREGQGLGSSLVAGRQVLWKALGPTITDYLKYRHMNEIVHPKFLYAKYEQVQVIVEYPQLTAKIVITVRSTTLLHVENVVGAIIETLNYA